MAFSWSDHHVKTFSHWKQGALFQAASKPARLRMNKKCCHCQMVIVLSRPADYHWKWLAKYILINGLHKLCWLETAFSSLLNTGHSFFFLKKTNKQLASASCPPFLLPPPFKVTWWERKTSFRLELLSESTSSPFADTHTYLIKLCYCLCRTKKKEPASDLDPFRREKAFVFTPHQHRSPN